MAKQSGTKHAPRAEIKPSIHATAGEFSLAQNFADASHDAMLLSDGDGSVIYANAAASQLFNTPCDALIGAHLRTLLPGCPGDLHHDAPGYCWTTRQSMLDGKPQELQLQLRTLDPPKRSMLALVATRTTSPANPPAHSPADIDSGQWAMAARGSMDGFWHRSDIERDETWWSPRIYQMLGYQPGELQPSFSALVERLHPQDRKHFLDARARDLLQGETFDMQARLRHASGEYRHFRIRALVTRSNGPEPTSLAGSIQDVTELHNAVSTLQVHQTRLHEMATAASAFFFELDEELRVVWLSDNFQSVTGKSPTRFIGQNLASRMPDGADSTQWDQYIKRLQRREPFHELIQMYTNPQGKVGYFSHSGFPVLDADGTFRGYRGTGIDVTARMEMENALRESEEKYRTIAEADQNAILVVDWAQAHIIDANDAASQLYGMSIPILLSSRATELFADPVAANELLETIRTVGGVTHHRDIHQHSDGHSFPVDISARHVTLSGKRCIVFMVQDMNEHEQALAALQQSEARFKAIIENAPIEIHVKDLDGHYLIANPELIKALDAPAEKILGHTAFDLWDAEFANEVTLKDQEVVRTNKPLSLEHTVKRPAGEREIFRVKFPIPDARNEPVGVATIGYDITHRNRTLRALEISERRFRDFADLAADYLWESDADHRFTFVSERCLEVDGIPASQMIHRKIYRIYEELHDELCDNEELRRKHFAAIAENRATQHESTRTRPDGSKVRVFVSAKPVHDADGKFTGYRGITRDITESYELSAQLAYQATHDFLTGLVNRPELERRLERLLTSAREDGTSHALCYLDLDQFKVVNDTSGHLAGDALLERLAETLTFRVRQRDTVARMGGDEFAILLEHCTIDRAMRVVNNLQESLSEFIFTWEDKQFQVGASMGLVPITAEFNDAEEILVAADSACYLAKDQGRNRIQIYSEEDAELARRRGEMDWVSRISGALADDQFRLRVQPIISLSREEAHTQHCELLVNLIDVDGTIIPPGAFFPAAERYNLATRIDRWVVTRALSWLATDDDGRGRPAICGINLSAQSLSETDFLEFIRGECKRFNIPASQLCFEITETAAIANLDTAIRFMHALKEDGARFGLDDFGKGLSSFGYLRTLPVDYIKIDAQFVRDVVTDPIDLAMVRSINEVARLMDKRTIAEGVESHEVLEVLRELGVDYAQGYTIGEPRFID